MKAIKEGHTIISASLTSVVDQVCLLKEEHFVLHLFKAEALNLNDILRAYMIPLTSSTKSRGSGN